ncbi:hypothetical protein GGTG_14239 [Gaeumannomyces tritici R3-111a-1]|uniref:Uncharacterized protein n=1 Tax=Gaeumannomyces tritici (strain R3-111a-1) TaxID=644352 RepID=J3PL07_GAET3|nr:hypothetical protein GGTG_14239 [Gaeumannomyces tritici R3-111a-1]EJT68181.1 hypothetical protein GGTG_14239 [Gaeumannomyces tritici R3-111a-1]
MVESAKSYLDFYTVLTVTSFFVFENKFVIVNIISNVLLNCQFFKHKRLKRICGAFLVFCSSSPTAFSNVLDVALGVIISGAKSQMPFLNLLDPFR